MSSVLTTVVTISWASDRSPEVREMFQDHADSKKFVLTSYHHCKHSPIDHADPVEVVAFIARYRGTDLPTQSVKASVGVMTLHKVTAL